ncbi:hypothetical protein Aperf_G00000081242 [Anoplocephala perfoliata]
MSREAPPLMRKLLLGQLVDIKYGVTCLHEGVLIHSIPFPPGRQLLFSLVWLQGYVLENSSSSPSPCFLLDDGTGSILVTIQADTELPPQGAYVSAIGEIVRAESSIQKPLNNCTPSSKSYQLNAKSIMCLSLVDNHFAGDDCSFRRHVPSSAYAELAWPLEVMDMSRKFSAPG